MENFEKVQPERSGNKTLSDKRPSKTFKVLNLSEKQTHLEEAQPFGTDSGQCPERPENSLATFLADRIIYSATVASLPSSQCPTKLCK